MAVFVYDFFKKPDLKKPDLKKPDLKKPDLNKVPDTPPEIEDGFTTEDDSSAIIYHETAADGTIFAVKRFKAHPGPRTELITYQVGTIDSIQEPDSFSVLVSNTGEWSTYETSQEAIAMVDSLTAEGSNGPQTQPSSPEVTPDNNSPWPNLDTGFGNGLGTL